MSETKFKPAWWLSNPHLQTLWASLCRPENHLPLMRERFELPDGDFIDLDWTRTGTGPIVLVLHGFEGSINSPYAKGILQAVSQNGWRGVFMNFRGCSGEPNRLPRSYHSGDTADLAAVVKALMERVPNVPVAAIGFSLGGNVLLKWLGETAEQNSLSAAIAVLVPFELQKSVERVRHGFSQIYQHHFLKCVCERMAHKFKYTPPGITVPEWESLNTLHDFDDKVTAPLHGFYDADDYYARCSSRPYLKNIAVPTLIIHAKDDPFMTEDIIPEEHELSAMVKLEVTQGGGHVGFVGGKYPWRPEYWIERRAPEFLQRYL